MSPNSTGAGIQQRESRPVRRAMLAAVLLAFAALVAPLCALMIACSMPCCEGRSFSFFQAAEATACADHCGISSNTASHELPDAVVPSSERPQISLAGLGVAEASDAIVATAPPRLPARSVEIHHARPGDAPLHVYNSVFLI